jgi:alkylation response protein AidB-like acyl-CoA dehydrogenase
MFSDVKVPKENRIEDGFGFNFAMGVLNGRIGIASQALGIATGLMN